MSQRHERQGKTRVPGIYADELHWRDLAKNSTVRLQWDPDHDPWGRSLPRRAIQLGLRGEALRQFAREWILHIEDVSSFVQEQRQHVVAGNDDRLLTPLEAVYSVADPVVARRLGVS